MNAFNDALEEQLGGIFYAAFESMHDDDGSVPSLAHDQGTSRRIGDRVLWRIIDSYSHGYHLYGLFHALPAKRRVLAQISLEACRMILPGEFNASLDFSRYLARNHGSLKIRDELYERVACGRFILRYTGPNSPVRADMISALAIDSANGDPDAALIASSL